MTIHPSDDPSRGLTESAHEDNAAEQGDDAKNPDHIDGTCCRAKDAKMVEDDTPTELPGDQRGQEQPNPDLGSRPGDRVLR
jgi:hypothetical protein